MPAGAIRAQVHGAQAMGNRMRALPMENSPMLAPKQDALSRRRRSMAR
jgi:hypothetical protein